MAIYTDDPISRLLRKSYRPKSKQAIDTYDRYSAARTRIYEPACEYDMSIEDARKMFKIQRAIEKYGKVLKRERERQEQRERVWRRSDIQ